MPVLPIRITGDPVLHARARDVEVFDDVLRTLVADMYETMDEAPGVGLVHGLVHVFVYSYETEAGEPLRGVAVNPHLFITPVPVREADEDTEEEGCLSFPGERFPLVRAERAILRAVDLDGTPFELEAEGWFARILQHEYDHLDGYLYVDRLAHEHAKPVAKVIRKSGWGVPGVSWLPGRDRLED
jgi:peptide deformylase